MTREELTNNWAAVILYYCSTLGSAHFRQDLLDVCEFSYDGNGDTYITTWFLSAPYSEPSIATLQALNLTTSQNYFNYAYLIPDSLVSSQPFIKITQTEINNLVMRPEHDGLLFFNSTTKTLMYYDYDTTSFKSIVGA